MQRTVDSDAVQSNPVKALFGKLSKSVDVLFRPPLKTDYSYTDPDLSQLIEERRYYL